MQAYIENTVAMTCAVWFGATMLHWNNICRHRAPIPHGRMRYAFANILKAAVLATLSFQAQWWDAVTDMITVGESEHHRHFIQKCVLAYCATDACQFLSVRMSRSTFIHHAITSVFGVVMAVHPGAVLTHPLGRALLWYGMCSALAFAVNFYLGVRIPFASHRRAMKVCQILAAVCYAMELVVNWPMHTGLIVVAAKSVGAVYILCYVMLTGLLMWDDIILLRFLLAAFDH